MNIRLVTLDLDDTLWAIAPAIERAEIALHEWLRANCEATAQRFSREQLRALRREVEGLHPELSGDITALRRRSIQLALQRGGDDEALLDEAFDVFWTARNEVEYFADVLPALTRLKSQYALAAVTNGNACLHRTGLTEFLDFSITARDAGCAKPARSIFHQACERAGVTPRETLHVGDDIECDVRGALAAGLHAVWINRDARNVRRLGSPAITLPDLASLADRLGV